MSAQSVLGRADARVGMWVVGLFFLALLYVYHATVLSMVAIWARSETFAHGFLILPISLWLIYIRWDEIAPVRPQPNLLLSAFLLPVGLVWLVAAVVDVQVLQQLALVAMVIVGTWSVLGIRLGRMLAFPLLFLFFAVPMGEGLIAPMMEYTATSTVWLIEMTGIPVYREGLHFTLPSGRWSVVEACSGVRYIIASVTVGTLYAYLTYRSIWRRALFILVSAIVPVFANSARAYIIVMLGHLSDMSIATGADHLVYGWVFFGLVVFLLFWLGSFFREDQQTETRGAVTSEQDISAVTHTTVGIVVAGLVAVAAAAVAPLMATTVIAEKGGVQRQSLDLPDAAGAWKPVRGSSWRWLPPSRLAGQRSAFYQRDGVVTGLYVQFDDGLFENAEVVGSSGLFTLEDSWERVLWQGKYNVDLPGGPIQVDEAQLRGRGSELLVWSWYLVGSVSTSNSYEAKILQLKTSVGINDPGIYRVVLAMPIASSLEVTRERMQRFFDKHGEALYNGLQP